MPKYDSTTAAISMNVRHGFSYYNSDSRNKPGAVPEPLEDAMASKSRISALTGRVARFISDRSGATAIEYGLLVAAIGGAIIGVVFLVGTEVADLYDGIQAKLGTRFCEQAHESCGKGNK